MYLRQILAAGLLLGLPAMTAAYAATTQTPLEQARILYKAGDYADAVKLLQTIPADAGKPGEIAELLGRAQFDAGQIEDAVDSMKKAVKAAPDNALYHFRLGVVYGRYVNDASILSKLGVAHDMRDEFKSAIKLKPDDLDARMALMQYYLFAPGIAGGDEDKAREQLAAIEKLDPARGAEAQAAFAMKAKHTDQAIALSEKALKLDPKLADAALSLGFLYLQHKQWEKAFAAFTQAVDIGGDDAPMARYQLGKIAAISGKHIEAGKAALRIYLEQNHPAALPQATYAHWRLGMIEEKTGALDQAREQYEMALKLDPDNKDARKALAALGKKG